MKNVLIFLLLIMIISCCKYEEFEPNLNLPNQSKYDTLDVGLSSSIVVHTTAYGEYIVYYKKIGEILNWKVNNITVNSVTDTVYFDYKTKEKWYKATIYLSGNTLKTIKISSDDNLYGFTRLDLPHGEIIGNVNITNAKSLIYLDIRYNNISEFVINNILDELINFENYNGTFKCEQIPYYHSIGQEYNYETIDKINILINRGWTVDY